MKMDPLRRLRGLCEMLLAAPGRARAFAVAQTPFASVATYYFLNGAMWPSFASRIPAIAVKDHLDAQLLGVALIGQAVGLAGAMLFSGRLVDRSGAKRVAPIAAVVYAGATALLGWAPNAPTLFGALVLWGMANAPVDSAANVLTARLSEPARGSLQVRLELAFSAGMVGGVGVGASLASRVSVQAHLTMVAAAGIVLALAAARFLPGDAVAQTAEGEANRWPALSAYLPRHAGVHRLGAPGRRPRHTRQPVLRLRRFAYNARLARLALLAMAGMWLEAVVPDWSGLYLKHELGAGAGVYGLGNVVFFVALTAAQIVAGTWLPARLRYVAVLAGGVSFMAGMLLATTAKNLPLALVGLAVCGTGAANIQPFAIEAARGIFGPSGAVITRIQTPSYLALALEKPVTGFLTGAFGYRKALASTIVIAALVCGLGLAVKQTE